MNNRLLKPNEAMEAMGGTIIPDEVYDHWWELTSKLLEAQDAKSIKLIIEEIEKHKVYLDPMREDFSMEFEIVIDADDWQALKSKITGGE